MSYSQFFKASQSLLILLCLLFGTQAFADDVPTLDLNPSDPLSENYATTYRENDPPQALSNNPSLIDADDTVMEFAYVVFFNPLDGTDEGLTIANPGNYNVNIATMDNQVIELLPNTPIATVEAFFANVSYRNLSDTPTEGDRVFQLFFRDPRSPDSDSQEHQSRITTITVSAYNDPPAVYVDGNTQSAFRSDTFVENSAPLALTINPDLNDPDSNELWDAEVELTTPDDGAAEYLFLDNPAAHPIQSQTAHRIVLQPNQTEAVIEAFFAAVKYENIDDTPMTTIRQIEFRASGDPAYSGGPTPISTGYVNLNIQAVNDLPVLDLDGDDPNTLHYMVTYTEGDSPVLASNNLMLIDEDSPFMRVAEVRLFGHNDSGEGLVVDNPAAFPGALITPTLIQWPMQTPQDVAALFAAVKYENPGENPTAGDVAVNFTFLDDRSGDTDGGATPLSNLTIITVIPQNDVPIVNLNAGPVSGDNSVTRAFTEDDPDLFLAETGADIIDVDHNQLQSLSVTLSNPGDGSLEGLKVSSETLGPITQAYTNHTLTLTGPADISQFNLALSGISYFNNSQNPDTTQRLIQFVANDGLDAGPAEEARINITAVNDQPIINLNGGGSDDDPGLSLSYTENDGKRPIAASDAAIIEPDGDDLISLTAQLSGALDGSDEALDIDSESLGALTKTWDQASGLLTISGPADAAAFTIALTGVNYQHSSEDPTPGDRLVTFNTSDGSLAALPAVATITVTPVNDLPIVDLNGPPGDDDNSVVISYLENAGPVTSADPTAQISDLDHTTLQALLVDLTTLRDSGHEFLDVPDGILAGVTETFDPGTGVLALIGPAPISTFQSILLGLTYENTSENPDETPRIIEIRANDGSELGPVAVATINVSGVNDAPQLTVTPTTPAPEYDEDSTALALNPTVTITDEESEDMAAARIWIADIQDGADEILAVDVGGSGLISAYANGELTLTGAAPWAAYQTVMATLTYLNSSQDPSGGSRDIRLTVNDGEDDSNLQSISLIVTPANDIPLLDLDTSAAGSGSENTFNEGDTPVALTSGTSLITDVDDDMIQSAQITLTNRPDASAETLAANAAGTLITTSAYDMGTGQLTLNGPDTPANFQTVLESVTYENTSQNPDESDRLIVVTVNDGEEDSDPVTATMNVRRVNDAPDLDLDAAAPGSGHAVTWSEDSGPVTLVNPNMTLTDFDDTQMEAGSATITLLQNGGDESLWVDTTGTNITGLYDDVSGELTLNGVDTIANYIAVLTSLEYDNTSQNPLGASRTVRIMVNDGDLDSNPADVTITINAENDAPSLALNQAPLLPTYTENGAPVLLDLSPIITDVDNTNMSALRITLSNPPDGSDESLAVDTSGTGITASYDPAGILNLTGSDTIAAYQSVLAAVTYQNQSQNPDQTTRDLTIAVFDGGLWSTDQLAQLEVIAINDAPILALNQSLPIPQYQEDNPPATLAINPIISDAEGDDISAAAVVLLSPADGADEVLNANPGATGIAVTYDALTHTLSLSGTAAIADYQTVLGSVTYINSSQNPSAGVRDLRFTVNDAAAGSDPQIAQITVTAANDAPAMTLTQTVIPTFTEGDGFTNLNTTAVISDVDDTQMSGAQITIVDLSDGAAETLDVDVTATGIAKSYTNGILTLSGNDTIANYQLVLATLSYRNNSDNPTGTSRQIDATVNDGDLDSSSQSISINIDAINDAPMLALNPAATPDYSEDNPAASLAVSPTITDADNTDMTGAALVLVNPADGGLESLSVDTTGTAINAIWAGSTLSLSGNDSITAYQAVLASAAYINTSQNPTAGAREIQFTVNDGAATSNTESSFINVIPINDAPTLTVGQAAAPIFTEGDAPATLGVAPVIADVDHAQMSSATLTITNPQDGANEVLAVSTAGSNIIAAYDIPSASLNLSGADTIAAYESVINTLTYANGSENPSEGLRLIEIRVKDGALDSNPQLVGVTVKAVNDAPVLSTVQTGTPTYTEGDPAASLATTSTITDPDDDNMISALITITNPADGSDEILDATVSGAISKTYNPATHTLSLNGSDTSANYQLALDSLTYANSSNNPSEGNRNLQVLINDGQQDSNSQSLQIAVISTNNPPTLSLNQSATPTFTEGDPATSLNLNPSISDPEETQMASATAALLNTPDGVDESLDVDTGITGIAKSFSGGVLTLTGTAPIADYQTVLASMTYLNSAAHPTDGSRNIEVTVNDGEDAGAAQTATLTVVSVNDAPVLTGETTSVDQGASTSLVDGGATTVLANDTDPEGDTISVDPAQTIGPQHGDLTLNADGTFSYTHDGGSEMTDSFTYTVCDDGSPSACASATVTITINPVIETTDHLAVEILRDGNICRPAVLSLSARAASGNVDTQYTGTFTITTSQARGDWILLDGSGTLTNTGNGTASYTFDSSDSGEVFVQLADNQLGVLNVNLDDGALTETSGAASPADDPDVNFIDSSGNPWRLESGTAILNDTSVTADFTTVTFQQAFDEPPLVFLTPTMEEAAPAALRLRNVSETGFEVIQVKPFNPANPDGTSVAMTVDYVAVDPGTHLLVGSNGATLVEACSHATTTFQDSNNSAASGYDTISLSGFANTPIVVAQIQSLANESAAIPLQSSSPWMTALAANPSFGSVDLALERSADSNGQINSAELIGYLAIDAGVRDDFDASGTVSFETLTTGTLISDLCPTTPFSTPFGATPLAIASKNSRNGGDGGWIRRCGLDSNGIDLRIDEDQAVDTERDHGGLEDASILAFSRAFHVQVPLPPPPNHFAINQTKPGNVCSPAQVTISAHDDLAHNVDTDYLGFITITTSTGSGVWSVADGSGTLTNRGNGEATYRFDAADLGEVVLGLSDSVLGAVDIDVTDGVAIEGPGEDNPINFIDISGLPWHMEVNTTTLSATGFATVSFAEVFPDAPLVFLVDSGEGDPAVLRIQNVSATGFQVVAAEHEKTASATNTTTIPATVTWLAVDPGRHEFPDGTVLEACTTSTSASLLSNDAANSSTPINFLNTTFASTPAVLTQIQTLNNERNNLPVQSSSPFITSLGFNVTSSGMDVSLERAEVAQGAVTQAELVAYLAVEAGTSLSFDDTSSNPVAFQSLLTGTSITHADTAVSFGTTYTASPLVIASQNTRNGTNGGWFRTRGATPTDVTLFCQEDNWADSELTHAAEQGSVLVFDNPFHAVIAEAAEPDHFAIQVLNSPNAWRPAMVSISARNGADAIDTGYTGSVIVSTSSNTGIWQPLSNAGSIVDLGNGAFRYSFDLLDAGEIILELSHPAGVVNIDVVDGDTTESPAQDPDLDFADVGPGSRQMETGTFTVNDSSMGATTVNFQTNFNVTPLVFLLEDNVEFGTPSAEPATLRLLDVSTTGFQTGRVEPSNQDGASGSTTATYLAVTPGVYQMPGGSAIEARVISTNRYQAWNDPASTWESVSFQTSFAAAPAVLSSIQTIRNETNTLPGAPSIPWMTATVDGVTANGLNVALERAEVTDGGSLPFPEHIAILAVESGSGSFTDDSAATVDYEAFTSPDTIIQDCTTVNFSGTYAATPIVIAAQSRRDGANGGWLRQCDLTQTGVGFHIQEDTFTDPELTHTAEAAGVMVFSQTFHVTF